MDEDLRRLEREARAGDPAASIRYARSLERDGRRGEAARVLRAVVEHQAARAELARSPAWTHDGGDAGSTRSLDVEPVVSTPRVLWRESVPDARRLVASPLGVACVTTRGLVVHDAGTGRVLWRRDAPATRDPSATWQPLVEILGGVLLVANDGVLSRHELATGTDLGSLAVPGGAPALLAGGLLVARDDPDSLVAHAVGAVDDGALRWRSTSAFTKQVHAVSVADDFVLVQSMTGRAALDRSTGRIRWRSRSVALYSLVDAGGLASGEFDRDRPFPSNTELVVRGPKGRVTVRAGNGLQPVALAPRFVLAGQDDALGSLLLDRGSLFAIDRGSGATRELPLRLGRFMVAVARDVICAGWSDEAGPRLGACRVSGAPLWELDLGALLGERLKIIALAVLDRTILVLFHDGTLVALTDL